LLFKEAAECKPGRLAIGGKLQHQINRYLPARQTTAAALRC